MAEVRITKVSAIETAPMGSNLIVVRIDTNQSGLYGYGCATYTQRHKAVVTAIEEYMNQLLVGRDALNVNDAWSVMMNSKASSVSVALRLVLEEETAPPRRLASR